MRCCSAATTTGSSTAVTGTVRIAADGRPDFLPPSWLDPLRIPRRNLYHRRTSSPPPAPRASTGDTAANPRGDTPLVPGGRVGNSVVRVAARQRVGLSGRLTAEVSCTGTTSSRRAGRRPLRDTRARSRCERWDVSMTRHPPRHPPPTSTRTSPPSGPTSTTSRAALRRMRERAEALFATGDKVAGDAYAAETLGRTLARRVAELADDPTTPLFFGRLDFAGPDSGHRRGHGHDHDSGPRPRHAHRHGRPTTAAHQRHRAGHGQQARRPTRRHSGDHDGRRYHVGRRHVTDDAGEPMVLDWRAPVSRSFYRASVRDPQGVRGPAPVRLRQAAS